MPTIKFSGYFTVDLICARTGLVKRHLRFRNLILDSGMNAIGNGTITGAFQSMFQYLGVGTGNTAPAVGQTFLINELARTSANGGVVDAATTGSDYRGLRRTYEFTELEANGNLTELGVFHGSAGINAGTGWCRQLFKDVGGSPTILTKTSAERLRIAYEVRMHFPTVDDATGSVTVNTINYPFTVRAVDINGAWHYTGPLSIWTLNPGFARWPSVQSVIESNALIAQTASLGGQVDSSSVTASAYVAGSFTRDMIPLWGTAIANFATNIGTYAGCWGGRPFQVAFVTTKLPKNNTQQVTITSRWTWARYP